VTGCGLWKEQDNIAGRVVFVGGKGAFSPSLLHDIPGTGWSLAIPGRDIFYIMHSIYASNYIFHCTCT